jgi:hypothetical protein
MIEIEEFLRKNLLFIKDLKTRFIFQANITYKKNSTIRNTMIQPIHTSYLWDICTIYL